MVSKEIIIYGSTNCPYCVKAKNFFTMLGFDYEYKELSDKEVLELSKKTGIDTIPQIFVDGEFIGGWIKTKSLYDEGQLMNMLK